MSKEPNRNVYVGHRYVPKIIGEWDKQQDYEGLSIVTNQGNSYTSKKRVPVGIDILNTEFWVVTGNYNAQVEYYRDETERVAEDLLLKSDKTYVDTELGKKANTSFVNTELGKKADTSFVNTELGKKSNQSYVELIENDIDSQGISINNRNYSHLKENIDGNTNYSKVMQSILDDGYNVILPAENTFIYDPVYMRPDSKISGSGNLSKLTVKGSSGINLMGTNGTFTNLSDFEILGGKSDSWLINIEDDPNTSPSSAIRWSIRNVKIFGNNSSYSNVTGIRMFGGYIADIYNPIIQGCEVGIDIIRNKEVSGTSFNSLNIFGGEIQGNKRGVVMEHVLVVNFFGTAIEGNRLDGVLIKDGSRMVNFDGVYFESNAIDDKYNTSDVNMHTTVWQNPPSVTMDNVSFLKGAYGGFTPVRINRGILLITGGSRFASYQNSDVMIKIDELVANGTKVIIDNTVSLLDGIIKNDTRKGGHKKDFTLNTKSVLPNETFRTDENGDVILDESGDPVPSPANAVTGTSDSIVISLPDTMSQQGNIVSTFIAQESGDIVYKYRVTDIETNVSYPGEFVVPVIQGYNTYSMNFDYSARDLIGKKVSVNVEREGLRGSDTVNTDIEVIQLQVEIFDVIN